MVSATTSCACGGVGGDGGTCGDGGAAFSAVAAAASTEPGESEPSASGRDASSVAGVARTGTALSGIGDVLAAVVTEGDAVTEGAFAPSRPSLSGGDSVEPTRGTHGAGPRALAPASSEGSSGGGAAAFVGRRGTGGASRAA